VFCEDLQSLSLAMFLRLIVCIVMCRYVISNENNIGLEHEESSKVKVRVGDLSLSDIRLMRLKKIREKLDERGVTCVGCVEKDDFAQLYFEHRADPVLTEEQKVKLAKIKAAKESEAREYNSNDSSSNVDIPTSQDDDLENIIEKLKAKGFSNGNNNGFGKVFRPEDFKDLSPEEIREKLSTTTGDKSGKKKKTSAIKESETANDTNDNNNDSSSHQKDNKKDDNKTSKKENDKVKEKEKEENTEQTKKKKKKKTSLFKERVPPGMPREKKKNGNNNNNNNNKSNSKNDNKGNRKHSTLKKNNKSTRKRSQPRRRRKERLGTRPEDMENAGGIFEEPPIDEYDDDDNDDNDEEEDEGNDNGYENYEPDPDTDFIEL
jgi:hypothetical protein